ncbi:MAG: lysylphosphatidylglycerol synthase transmembrane domain-containing protein [Phycisphaerae bacterium]
MTKQSQLRWVLPLLRYGLCAVAIWYLVTHVSWYDRVALAADKDTRVPLLETRGDVFVVIQNGKTVELPREQIRYIRVDGVDTPDVELGIRGVAQSCDWKLALWAILLFAPVPFLQSLRLIWMLAIQEVRLSFWSSVKLSFAGNFFNFALPGTTGGDLIKAVYITRHTHRKTEAVLTVFLDRVIGLFGLVLIAGTMIIVAWDARRFGKLAWVLAGICAALGIGLMFILSHRLRHAIGLPALAQKLPMGDQLLRVGRATVAMRHHPSLLALSLLNTIVLQVIVLISAWAMGKALGLSAPFMHYFIYVPIGFLIAAIPISPPQAFGVMEWAYVQFFAHRGYADVSQAVAFALAVRLIQLVWALPGILVPLLGAHMPARSELEALNVPEADAPVAAQSAATRAP